MSSHGFVFSRIQKELQTLEQDPPPGICVWPQNDCLLELQAGNSVLFYMIQTETNNKK